MRERQRERERNGGREREDSEWAGDDKSEDKNRGEDG